jgi:hypothetical protein
MLEDLFRLERSGFRRGSFWPPQSAKSAKGNGVGSTQVSKDIRDSFQPGVSDHRTDRFQAWLFFGHCKRGKAGTRGIYTQGDHQSSLNCATIVSMV